MNTDTLDHVADFLYETGILAKTPRSGFWFLGSGGQSVAEHINRMCYVGYALAKMEGNVDTAKVVEMCLFHDLTEARTSDLNYVHQKYGRGNEAQAFDDVTSTLPFGDDMKMVVEEYEKRQSAESIIAKDADNIEFILSLKEQADTGNTRAADWIPSAVKRLKTASAQQLIQRALAMDSAHWWFDNPDDEWWISRKSK